MSDRPLRIALLAYRGNMRQAFGERIEAAAPRYMPAAGALLEAYRIAGKTGIQLTDVPEFDK